MAKPEQNLSPDPQRLPQSLDTSSSPEINLERARVPAAGLTARHSHRGDTVEISPAEAFVAKLQEKSAIKANKVVVSSLENGKYLTFEDLIKDIHENQCDKKTFEALFPCNAHGIAPIMMTKDKVLTLALRLEDSSMQGVRSSSAVANYFHEFIAPRALSFLRLQPQQIQMLVVNAREYEQLRSLSADPEERIRALKTLSPDASATKVFYSISRIAIEEGASDIHIEPHRGNFRVRYRVDGVLKTRFNIEHEVGLHLTAIIKNKSRMQLEEKRRPQDGRIFPDENDLSMEPVLDGWSMRVSTTPAQGGEKTVLRLLQNVNQDELDLQQLGLPAKLVQRLQEVMSFPQGLILVTGPTGSGKTTTLYSALRELNTDDVNISTAEDPVEVRLDGVNQVQVNTKIELHFADILRSFLRQDPDIILVGEIRDDETAKIAIQAALTGHLVFATVHTNDSFSTITRLETLGVDRDLIQSTLSAVISQRLVRTLCDSCKVPYEGGEHLNAIFKEQLFDPQMELFNAHTAGHSKGSQACKDCNGVGYKGREAIAELWVPGSAERDLILKGQADGRSLLELARQRDMEPMIEHALKRVAAGSTTLHECLRGVFSLDQLVEARDLVLKIFGKPQH